MSTLHPNGDVSQSGKSSPTRPHQGPAGPGRIVSAAIAVALLCGVLFGLADAVVADLRLSPPRGLWGYIGCYSAAVMTYSALFSVFLVPAGLLLMAGLRTKPLSRLLILALFAGLFAELYWWSRPYVFYGHSAVSPERLAALVAQVLIAFGCALVAARLLLKLPRSVHVGLRFFALACVLIGVLFSGSERSRVESRGVLNDRNRDLPNVLLVIVDALRADHLGAYGNERVKTPNMDALAERGVLFENCFAQAPYTLTSFGSILTGKYPRRHGLVAQRAGVQMKPNVTLPIHLKTAKIAGSSESLRDEDYATATFMTGAVSHGSGLARGFDAYSEAMMGHDLVETDSQWSTFRSELLVWLFKNKLTQRVDSSLVVTTARKWLRERKGRRWMAMVHLYSTHTPYDPPAQFKQPYLDPTYGGPISAFYAEHRYALERGDYEPNDADVQQIRDLYLAGAAQADAQIGELMGELKELGMLEDTLVILTSDHGEDLGEWRPVGSEGDTSDVRFWEHNHMWQTNLRVPMILANTKLLPHGKRIEDLVESVDLMPTLCDLMGLEWPREEGVMEVDGHSLVPRILGVQRGEQSTYLEKPYSFTENNLFLSIQSAEEKLIVPRRLLDESDPEVMFDAAQWVRYYDLRESPGESENSLMHNRERAIVLWKALRDYDKSMPRPEYLTTARDREQEELLMKLGYAGGIEYEETPDDPSAEPASE